MKIIIDNRVEWLNTSTMMDYVNSVIKDGKISNGTYGEQFCFITRFTLSHSHIYVSCEKRKSGTFKFVISSRDIS